ncbi:MAG: transketolase [Alphaproteobacteria bacterium]|nr:transketolase [Alphaproteobacteria bacterium]
MDNASSPEADKVGHNKMANAIRALSMDAVQLANSGHPGAPMGMADIATVLFTKHLIFDANAPKWPNRDRFILSNGHASILLYSLLYLTGYSDMTIEEIKRFRQLGSRTAGHPEYGHASGIETTTGPLGQGLANAVGVALAERMKNARFGNEIVDHFTYVFVGDGCLMEGISHEAISMAGHLKLEKLIVLFDDNSISIDGETNLTVSDNQIERFLASGWDVNKIDGHDPKAIDQAIIAAKQSNRPSLIACQTVIGFGAPNKQGTSATHGAPLGPDEITAARKQINWPYEPFIIPDEILNAWRDAGKKGAKTHDLWKEALEKADKNKRDDFDTLHSNILPKDISNTINAHKLRVVEELPNWATRKASEETLKVLTEKITSMIGGSADLTGSNNTKTTATVAISALDYSGRYIYYGVREHAMAAVMNGLALHGGFIPYGGTFLTFTDYCRPSIRLAALMKLRVIYVMTHDSIGLGEDGPTHQAVEHIASFRAMPNVNVFRPADAIETAECWLLAIQSNETPSVLALTRQGLPTIRKEHTEDNLCARGAYVIAEALNGNKNRNATILATGSEVEIALKARDLLQADGIATAVVSMPCWEIFEQQKQSYKNEVLGKSGVRIAVEAAACFGWARYVLDESKVIGMREFGASAPISDLYEHFGISPKAVADAVRSEL